MGKERRQKVVATVGGIAVALLIGELVARAYLPTSHHHKLYVRSADPVLGVDLRPGADFQFEGGFVEIPGTRVVVSSQGLRGPELEIPKPPGPNRLLCVGDSTTFGWGVEVDETWCHRLGLNLGARWVTANLGVPGYNTRQEVRLVELIGLPFEPDLIVLQHEEGDSDPPLDNSPMGSVPYFFVGRSALLRLALGIGARFEASAQSEEEEAMLGGLGETEGAKAALDDLRRLGAEHHFDIVVFTDNPLDPVFQEFDPGALTVEDLTQAVPLAHDDLRIPGDGHWNAEGHQRVADRMISRLHARGLVEQ